MPGMEALFEPRGLVIELKSGGGIGHTHIIKSLRILLLRRVEAVRRFLTDEGTPRLLRTLLLEPVQRQIRDDGGVIAFDDLPFLAVDVPLRVEVAPLPFMGHEMVKTGPRLIVVLAHVILAKVSGGITSVVQQAGKARHRIGILGEVVHHPMRVRIKPAQDARPARRAQRGGAEGVRKAHALARQTVDVRRFDMLRAVAAQRIGTEIIAEDEEHIRL